jgi:hypothetical protein
VVAFNPVGWGCHPAQAPAAVQEEAEGGSSMSGAADVEEAGEAADRLGAAAADAAAADAAAGGRSARPTRAAHKWGPWLKLVVPFDAIRGTGIVRHMDREAPVAHHPLPPSKQPVKHYQLVLTLRHPPEVYQQLPARDQEKLQQEHLQRLMRSAEGPAKPRQERPSGFGGKPAPYSRAGGGGGSGWEGGSGELGEGELDDDDARFMAGTFSMMTLAVWPPAAIKHGDKRRWGRAGEFTAVGAVGSCLSYALNLW